MPGSNDPADAVPAAHDAGDENGELDLLEPQPGLEEDAELGVLDALPNEDTFEERRSRLRGIARLFGGLFVGGSIAAFVVALAVALLAGLGPRMIVVIPGTTEEPTPSAERSSEEPEPVETITKRPGDAE